MTSPARVYEAALERLGDPLFLMVTTAVLALAGLVAQRLRRRPLRPAGLALGLVAAAYGAVLLAATGLADVLTLPAHDRGFRWPQLTPGRGIASYLDDGITTVAAVELAGNVLLFVPLGVLLAIRTRLRPSTVALIAVSTSVLIEGVQTVTGTGTGSVDDVLLNTAGALAGGAAVRVARAPRRPGEASCASTS